MYQPSSIEKTAEQIREKRAQAEAKKQQTLTLNDAYRKLFLGMAEGNYNLKDKNGKKIGAEAGAAGLGYCLSKQEKELLCSYLCTEAKAEHTALLGTILCEDMDAALLALLYEAMQDNYDRAELKPLFSMLCSNKNFGTEFQNKYKIKPEGILKAFNDGNVVIYVNTVAGFGGSRTQGSYTEALADLGIAEGKKLYRKCAELYAIVCDAAEYQRIGVEGLKKLSADFSDQLRKNLLCNMLTVLDAYQLRQFIPMLPEFMALTGEEGSKTYKEVLGDISPAHRDKYRLWTNQYSIWLALGSGERADFWLNFSKSMRINRHAESGALLLDFGKFVVIEFVNESPAYFYDKKYFTEHVSEGLALSKSEEALVTWLHDKTEWASQGENLTHWRKAHVGSWQLDMKEYINKYSR